jgi:hypothetical protein
MNKTERDHIKEFVQKDGVAVSAVKIAKKC